MPPQNVDAGIIVPGDLVLLAAGSAIPADTYVNEARARSLQHHGTALQEDSCFRVHRDGPPNHIPSLSYVRGGSDPQPPSLVLVSTQMSESPSLIHPSSSCTAPSITPTCCGLQGEIEVDQSAMTGESLPVKFHPGEVRAMAAAMIKFISGSVRFQAVTAFAGRHHGTAYDPTRTFTLFPAAVQMLVSGSDRSCRWAKCLILRHIKQFECHLPPGIKCAPLQRVDVCSVLIRVGGDSDGGGCEQRGVSGARG
jgi:hypothetical protein